MGRMVRFLDLKVVNSIAYNDAISKVFSHGQFILGPEVQLFEKKMCAYTGRKYCLGVSSGSDALFLSLKALGIRAGDEVITTSLSWIATANAISLTGAKPVFVDIDHDLNISPQAIIKSITPKTKCILSVDFTGKLCNYNLIEKIAKDYNLLLVEDASQAFGATDQRGRPSGSFGDISAISHNPMKVLAALGEAGSILTDDEDLYKKLSILRYAGTINREICVTPSLNHRLDTIQASILLANLATFEKNVLEPRSRNAALYDKHLPDIVFKPAPSVYPERQVYYTYSARVPNRDLLMEYLSDNLVETKVQHKLPMPSHPAYSNLKTDSKTYPEAIKACNEIICLPIHEKLTIDDILHVCDLITKFYLHL